MRAAIWLILAAALVMAVLGVAAWLGSLPARPPASPDWSLPGQRASPIRLGLVSEGDVFEQRRRFRALADLLERRIDRPVELVTESNYDRILASVDARRIDAALVAPLGAVVLEDSCAARVLAHSISARHDGSRPTIFVREDSTTITSLEHLSGRSIAMVRSTACGDLFPRTELAAHGLVAGQHLKIIWAADPDEVARLVAERRAHAGAALSATVDEAALRHAVAFRPIAHGELMPGPALVVHGDLAVGLGQALAQALLDLHRSAEGRSVLAAFDAASFVRSDRRRFEWVRGRLADLEGGWESIGVTTPAVHATANTNGAG